LLGSAASAGSSAFFRNITIPGSDIITSISRSINSAVVSVTVNLLDNINPVISTVLRSTGLVGAVENMLNTEGLFNGVFTILSRVVPTAFNMAGNIVSGLFDGAKTFVELVTENGPLAAMNTALNSLFTRETVETVMDKGGLDDILSQPPMWVTLPDGRIAQEIVLSGSAAIFLDETGEIASIMEDGITSTGSFVWTADNRLTMENGVVEGGMETGYSMYADVEGGQTWNITIDDEEGNEIANIDPEQPNGNIRISSVLNSINSEFNFALTNVLLCFANNYMAKINGDIVQSITQKVNAISAGSLFNNTNKFIYALANGIGNTMGKGISPQYIDNMEIDLNEQSDHQISYDDMCSVALFNPTIDIPWLSGSLIDGTNSAIDIVKWVIESQTIARNELVKQAATELCAYFITNSTNWNRPVVGMGYSGGLMPLVEAVSKTLYNVKTFIGLGAATVYIKPDIVNNLVWQAISAMLTNNFSGAASFLGYAVYNRDVIMEAIKTKVCEIVQQSSMDGETFPYSIGNRTNLFVNVWGTKDVLYEFGLAGYRDSFCGVQQIYNIEIVGAEHFDYIRGVNPNNPNPAWNNTVADFCTNLTIASEDEDKLKSFIQGKKVDGTMIYDEIRKTYIVHLPGCGI